MREGGCAGHKNARGDVLGPGVMLRVAEDGALKMLSNSSVDTRLELLAGTAILQSKDPLPGNSVTVLFKDWQLRVLEQGVYRIDSNPPQIRVSNGRVEVPAGQDTQATAKAGQTLPFVPPGARSDAGSAGGHVQRLSV